MPSAHETDAEIAARFWAQVEKTDGCWLWLGAVAKHGYGQFWVKRKNYRAHRFAYLLTHGALPESPLVLDHLCRTPRCVRPDHLEAVTSRENTLRGYGPTAQQARKTHCKRGHPFTPDNVYAKARYERACGMCRREDWANRSPEAIERDRIARRNSTLRKQQAMKP